jgi:hypothetical protein
LEGQRPGGPRPGAHVRAGCPARSSCLLHLAALCHGPLRQLDLNRRSTPVPTPLCPLPCPAAPPPGLSCPPGTCSSLWSCWRCRGGGAR